MKSSKEDGISRLRALDVNGIGQRARVHSKKHKDKIISFLLRLEAGEDYNALKLELDVNEARLCNYILRYPYIRALYQSIILDPNANIIALLEFRMLREIMRMKETTETRCYKVDAEGKKILVRVDKTIKDSKLKLGDILQVLQTLAPEKWKGQTLESLADSLYDGIPSNTVVPPPLWANTTSYVDETIPTGEVLGNENSPAMGQEPISD